MRKRKSKNQPEKKKKTYYIEKKIKNEDKFLIRHNVSKKTTSEVLGEKPINLKFHSK